MEANTIGLAEYYEQIDPVPAMVESTERKKGRRPTRARTQALYVRHNDLLDVDPVRFACRCWRCRDGGVPAVDMAQMDRILARHLLRMPEMHREDWIRTWSAVPKHRFDEGKLRAWLDIESGKSQPEPVYRTKGESAYA